jgi:hypothetical protein
MRCYAIDRLLACETISLLFACLRRGGVLNFVLPEFCRRLHTSVSAVTLTPRRTSPKRELLNLPASLCYQEKV